MAHIASKMLWVRSLLHELGLDALTPMQMHCDSHATIFIVNNLVFHEHTKHIKVSCHFSRFIDREANCHYLCSH